MARFGYCISVAAFGLGLLGAPALAADLLPPPPPPPPPLAAPVEIGTGWYLRGDYTASDFRRPKDDTLPGTEGAKLVGFRLGDTDGYGGGIGYVLGQQMRLGFDVNYMDRTSDADITRNYEGVRAGFTITYGLKSR